MTDSARVVEFAFNEFATVTTRVVDAVREERAVLVTIEVAPDVWETIDLLQLFHLRWDARGAGAISGTRDVQIEMRLDADLAAAFDDVPDDAGALAAVLDEAPGGSPLREQSSWYALSVTEPVELPPDLAAKGEIRAGFTTVWAEPANG